MRPNLIKIEFFSINLAQCEILGNFNQIWHFFENTKIDILENLTKIDFFFETLTKIEIFKKIDQKNEIFFRSLIIIENFRKFWPKSKFIENLTKNWKFSEVLTKFEFFENLTKILENLTKAELFENLTKSKFFENLTKRVIFDQNRYISKFWPKFFEILEHFV